MGGAVAEALCVDVEGCAPAELPWATLLGVICESGHSHPPGASSWGTRKVTNAEGRAVLPQLPTSQASFTPPPHPRTLRAFWLAVCGDPAVGVSQVPDLFREPAGLPVRTAPPGAQRLLSAKCIYSHHTVSSFSGSSEAGVQQGGQPPEDRVPGTSLPAWARAAARGGPPPPPSPCPANPDLPRAPIPPGTRSPPVPGCRSAVKLQHEKNKHLTCRL
ncbi:formin-2 [Bos taurus]|uniref:formin-2 n=1 Tax=Bos taurus TaxID=9913 RepID=UPI000760241E|nr:formin-2-like [Bos taurus]